MVEFSQKLITGIILFSFIVIGFASIMANVATNSEMDFNDSEFEKYNKIQDIQEDITNPMRDNVFDNDTTIEESSASSSILFSKNVLNSLKLIKNTPSIVSGMSTDALEDLGVSNSGLIFSVILALIIIGLVYSIIKILL